MTLLENAKNNIITPLIKRVSLLEKADQDTLLKNLREGKAVIPLNRKHKIKKPCAIGLGLSTKINANLGTSSDKCDIKNELKKLDIAVKYGADTIMDLSTGGSLKNVRREMLFRSSVPVGTVPIYEIAVNAKKKRGNLFKFSAKDILEVLETQAQEGVDFFTVHSGVTLRNIRALKKKKRLMGIVSRGGAIIAAWMEKNKRENPFYEYFDHILDIAYEYDVCLSLGDGLRPGSVMDATDPGQIAELKTLGELALRARKRNVQIMIEGPGHVPINQIKQNIAMEKKICRGAPFYVLGPLVTDVAPGYDHITSAIGGALAASYGADFLCYVTPSEHLRLPSIEDVKEGVIASKIAAHAADIAKGLKKACAWDKAMSTARKNREWEKQIRLAIDPDKAREYRRSSKPSETSVCTMCAEFCSIKISQDCLK